MVGYIDECADVDMGGTVADFPAHLFRMDGEPGAIRASADKWSSFGTAASDASAQITGLDTGSFIGTEGDMFRDGLNEDMPRHLTITGDAFGRVSTALTTFAGTLGTLQAEMRPLAARAPGLWEALQAAQGRVDRAASADRAHEREQEPRDPAGTSPDTYHSDTTAATGALSSARAEWDAAVSRANGLRDQLNSAVSTAAREIGTAKDMRFKENPKWWDIGGQFTNFVRDNKDLLQKLSGALKIVSLVAGLLSFIPVLAPIMGPIALGSALLASAIDLSIYAATGEGSLKTILIDVGLNLLPGVGKLARMGAGALRGTRVASAFSSVAQRGRNMMSVARWGLSNPRLNGIEAVKRLVRLDPIDIATGAMVLSQTDVDLPGALPLVLTRTHISSYRLGSWFGRSWASTLDQRLEADESGVYVSSADGMTLIYPTPVGTDPVLPVEGPRWPLRRTDSGYQVSDPWRGHTWHYAPAPDDPAGQSPLAAVTDRHHHRIDIVRTGDGTPVEVVHSGGYRVRVVTDANRVVALSLGDTELLRFGYNEFGDLTEVVNSSGLPQRFEYDVEGRATAWIDRNGTEYRYTYDEAGRCVATGGTGGYLAGRIHYDTEARTTTVVDSLGHATVYQLNDQVQTESVTDPLGNLTRYTWDRYDRKLSETDPLGRTTRYVYSDDGDLVEIVRADGTTATAVYNDLHQPTHQTGFDGTTWIRGYDDRGTLLSVTDPLGATTRYSYEDGGRRCAITDAVGHTRRIDSDAAGLPVAVTDPLGATTTYARGADGRITEITGPAGETTRIGYTTDGKPAWRTLPDGATDRWAYDAEGNLTGHTDALGNSTTFEVGAFDLPAARIDAVGARVGFSYDSELRLVAVTNPQGLTWRYDYDAGGRLVAETDFDGRTLRYTHDAAGQLVARVNGMGQRIGFVRDPLGNIVEKNTPDGRMTFAYNAGGHLVHAANPDATVEITRDPLGRVLAESINGRTTTFEYDAVGRQVHRRTPSGASSSWEYGPGVQPVALHTSAHTVRFGYDSAGRMTERVVDEHLTVLRRWDPNHRLASQEITAGAARVLGDRTYRYRADGHLIGIDDRDEGRRRRLTLDRSGRITTVDGREWTERYVYDAAGNVTTASWPETASGAETQGDREYAGTLIRRAGRTRYEHDAQGRVRAVSDETGTWRYTWDAEDRLIAVATADGQRWRYRYDPLGRRIAKQRLAAAGGAVLEQTDFSWAGTLLAEQTRTTWSGSEATVDERVTVWDWEPDGVRPVSQTERHAARDASQESIDERFYAIVTDLAGTPTELVTAGGRVAWRSRSTVWGTSAPADPDGTDCPLRFPGQYFDSETRTAYNYFRYYDPATGRYRSADPIGLSAGPNPYAYVPNPLRWTDPFGLAPANYGRTTLYHGSPNFDGPEFILQTAVDRTRLGTGAPGVYLTDDAQRAMTQFGRGGHTVRTEVPSEFADAIRQTDRYGRTEYFVNTPEGIETLNQGITDILPTNEAIVRWVGGTF